MVNEFSMDCLEKEPHQVELLLLACTEALKKEQKPIILFGSGVIGRYYLSFLKKVESLSELYFCDNNPEKWGTTVEGIPIISFDDLKSTFRDSYIIITSVQFYDEILLQLKENNLNSLLDPSIHKVMNGDIGFYENFKDYFRIIENNSNKFSTVYGFLADEDSKQIFLERINYCLSMNTRFLTPLKSKSPQYFEPGIISLSDEEIFIDAGAYIGDTVEEFLRQTKGEYKKIYSFEPEESKHMEFLQNISDFKEIELIPYGLWSKNTSLRFQSENSVSSTISQNGDSQIQVTTIDETLKGGPATFIKMDIEGAELEALYGAEQTIKKYKPKLAVCVYHKPLDIVEIPIYLKRIVPNYKLFLRHYSEGPYETVLYAVVDH